MHGRKKVSKDQIDAAQAAEMQAKIAKLKGGLKKCLEFHHTKNYSPAALEVSTKVLGANPEYYTVWNYRREAITQLIDNGLSGDNLAPACEMFERELEFLLAALTTQPKCYAIWNHRQWIVEMARLYGIGSSQARFDMDHELSLCDKMLKADERNFHCWVYRTRLAKAAGRTLQQEFEMTSRKINENFSNFSAWHLRSKLLPSLLPLEPGRRAEADAILNEEFDKLHNAFWCEPADQSAWLYHRWLMSHIARFQVESRHGMRASEASDLAAVFGGAAGSTSQPQSPFWSERYAKAQALLQDLKSAVPDHATLENEIKTCTELLEAVEDDGPLQKKWVMHNLAALLETTGESEHLPRIAELYGSLAEIDEQRKIYYADKRSTTVLDHALREQVFALVGGKDFVTEGTYSDSALVSLLGSVRCLDLSNNELKYVGEESSICQVKPNLQNITKLNLANNKFETMKSISDVLRFTPSLEELNIAGNPLVESCGPVGLASLAGGLPRANIKLIVK